MGYIRSNEDYYISEGMSPDNAKLQVEMDRLGANSIDYGYCNPRKAKIAQEDEDALREEAQHNLGK